MQIYIDKVLLENSLMWEVSGSSKQRRQNVKKMLKNGEQAQLAETPVTHENSCEVWFDFDSPQGVVAKEVWDDGGSNSESLLQSSDLSFEQQ
jgi:hypothetical protein